MLRVPSVQILRQSQLANMAEPAQKKTKLERSDDDTVVGTVVDTVAHDTDACDDTVLVTGDKRLTYFQERRLEREADERKKEAKKEADRAESRKYWHEHDLQVAWRKRHDDWLSILDM